MSLPAETRFPFRPAFDNTDAACKGLGRNLVDPKQHPFYPTKTKRGAPTNEYKQLEKDAKALCQTCPIITECREYALEYDERHGVWGGLTAPERQFVLKGGSISCGTMGKYRIGCRCPECRYANSKYKRPNSIHQPVEALAS